MHKPKKLGGPRLIADMSDCDSVRNHKALVHPNRLRTTIKSRIFYRENADTEKSADNSNNTTV